MSEDETFADRMARKSMEAFAAKHLHDVTDEPRRKAVCSHCGMGHHSSYCEEDLVSFAGDEPRRVVRNPCDCVNAPEGDPDCRFCDGDGTCPGVTP